MEQKIHWSSKALVLFGMWLWDKGEFGHALLCMHAPQWGFKIGTQLSITWYDVIYPEDCMAQKDLVIPDKETAIRPINYFIKETIEVAYAQLPIAYIDDSIYMNYKSGKPLTSSTLNRELQRFSEKFLVEIKEKTGFELNFKALKTNAFEIAWALDMVKKYHYSKQVFSALSSFMGHRTVKDTIKLLEVEPSDRIEFDFDNVKVIPNMMDMRIFKDDDALREFIYYKIVHEGTGFVPLLLKK